jgi:hypothetical protein
VGTGDLLIHALGFSHNTFNPVDPGRLCRGRERWIEPYDLEEPAELFRLVISGAAFTDDSARDAQRGLPHSGVDAAQVIAGLFPRRALVAFMEDGHPADIPEEAEGVEAYTGYRAGGRSEEVMVRWYKKVSGIRDLREVLGNDPTGERVRGFAVLQGDEDLTELLPRLFLLVGMSTLDSPPARYQPAALPEVLEIARAVVVMHRDKHGPALGIYSKEPVKADEKLEALCEKGRVLLVPFAIPPMLARWDRALAELRQDWMVRHGDEFPVPPAMEPSGWEPRRRRRHRDDREEGVITGEE